jgi:Spy/CpxP family protein refolding chaperone
MKKNLFTTFLFLLFSVPAFMLYAGMPPAGNGGPNPYGFPSPAMAPHGGPGGPMQPPSILNFAEELNLTGDQFDKIRAIEKETSTIEETNRKLMRKNMDKMQSEIDKAFPDEKKLDAIIAEMSVLQKEMMTNQVHNILKFKMVLTKEQQKMLKDMFRRNINDNRDNRNSFPVKYK